MRYRANRWALRLTALALSAVLAPVLEPAVAHAAFVNQSAPPGQEETERLAGEFSAVLSLREAPDSMCVSANLDGESIFASRSTQGLVPASLMKVVTAAAALEVMPPDQVFSTKVFADAGALESATNGVLAGDVYLVGQGDPVLNTPRYANRYLQPVAHTKVTHLADRVVATLSRHGIRRIEGRLVGDESWFPDMQRDYSRDAPSEGADPVWKRSFVTSNNAGPLSALLLNDGYSAAATVRTSAARRRQVRATNPAQHAASAFDNLLEARGMVITKRPVAGVAPAPGERTLLGTIESPPLAEILARMLTYSDNTIAEMILKEVGRRISNSDRVSAAAAVEELIREKLGSAADGVVVADGSGLSSYNRLTCAAIAGLIDTAGPGSPVVEGLSVPGRTGTLVNCRPYRSTPGPGDLNPLMVKSGTLNDVTAVAGTTVATNGETLTFAMIANGPGLILLGSCNRLRRTVLNAAASYTYGPVQVGAPDHPGDREALVALFDRTGGEAWFNTWGWKTDSPLSRWHGVATDSTGRVTGLDLGGRFGNNLVGPLPGEIGRLSELVRLDLSGNELSGRLPDRISDLTKLQDLRLGGTGLCVPRVLPASWESLDILASVGLGTCPRFFDSVAGLHAESLDALAAQGVLDGTECAVDRICPDDAIERWTVAVWIVRALDGRDPPGVNGTAFADVDSGVWWMRYVERLAALGVTKGCGTEPLRYCPGDSVTRDQMASFLVRAWDLAAAPPAGFVDVDGNFHQADIDALASAGITIGCGTDPLRYCPAQPVTRGEMATFLIRALRLAGTP